MRFGHGQRNDPSRFLSEIPQSLLATDDGIEEFVLEELGEEDKDGKADKSKKYEIGDEIIHSRWGKGTIVNLKEDKGLEITVQFKKGMAKNLLAEYAPIRKV